VSILKDNTQSTKIANDRDPAKYYFVFDADRNYSKIKLLAGEAMVLLETGNMFRSNGFIIKLKMM